MIKLPYMDKKERQNFVKQNILQTTDMQSLLERFIIDKYQEQLYSN